MDRFRFADQQSLAQKFRTIKGRCRAAALPDRICCSHTCRGSHSLLAKPHISGVRPSLPYVEMSAVTMMSCLGALTACPHHRPIPIESGSPSTVHCMQVAEISRVLKPGGVFVASTFLKASAPLGQLFNNDDLFRPLNAVGLLQQTAFTMTAHWAH